VLISSSGLELGGVLDGAELADVGDAVGRLLGAHGVEHPTSRMAAANSSGAAVTARPAKMPPALVPQMPSVAGDA
jgi:hypothetical protein